MSSVTEASCQTLAVNISQDAMEAQLHVPEGLDESRLTMRVCADRLAVAGVVVNERVQAQLNEQITTYRLNPVQTTFVVRGQAAVDGRDGWIAWRDECNPDRPGSESDQSNRIDHYSRRSYITVDEMQGIGRIVQPTVGRDGMDLRGHVAPCKRGQPTPMCCDQTIHVDESGVMTAIKPGLLKIEGNTISVSQQLQIAGCVDFHTGNVCFDGDVEIKEGIRDKFSVEATGSVTVHGLIEAAILKIGRDLIAMGGIAAKGKSSANIEGDLRARYLNGFCGRVKKNAIIDREVIDCNLNVEGDLIAPNGELIGGKTCVAGTVNIKSLGAVSGDRTVLTLACIQSVETLIARMEETRQKAMDQLKAAEVEMEQLQNYKQPPAAIRERLTELMFDQSNCRETITSLATKKAGLRKYTEKLCRVDLSIQQGVQPGTIIKCHGVSTTFDTRVPGPVFIAWDAKTNQLVYRIGLKDPFQSIDAIARVQRT